MRNRAHLVKFNARLFFTACACSALVLFSSVLRAQDATPASPGNGPGQRAGQERGEILKKLATALDLTDEQKADIKSIVEQRRAKILALRENKSIPPEQKKAQVKEILQASMQQIKGILTPDQQQKLEQIIQRVKQRRDGGSQQPQQ
jgi:Spy/CpxP family protein refolding chaperone